MVRLLLVGGFVVAAVFGAVCACTPFGAEAAGDGGAAADGGADGPGDGGDAPPVGGGSCDAAGADFCDDFEDERTWKAHWTASADSVTATVGAHTSGEKAIDVDRLETDGPKLIAHTLRAGSVFKITVQMKVIAPSGGDLDLVGITDTALPTLGGNGVSVVWPNGGKAYQVEASQPDGGIKTQDLTSTFAEWTKVTLTVDLGKHEYTYAVGDSTSGKGLLDTNWKPGTLYVKLGAYFAPTTGGEWHVRFDDAAVTVR